MSGMGPVHELRVGEPDAKAQDGAADRTVDRGDHVGSQPELAHPHAQVFGLLRVVAQRPQVQAKRRMHDAPHDEAGEHQQSQAVVVEGAGQQLDLVVGVELQPDDLMRGTRMPLSPPVRW